jgi:putative membrane protein insertion efficiency factor
MRDMATRLLCGLILLYRYGLAPLLPGRCRYLPTCSHYGLEALRVHGPLLGAWLTLRRLMRCHPWGGHGFDPVPVPRKMTGPAPADRATLENR